MILLKLDPQDTVVISIVLINQLQKIGGASQFNYIFWQMTHEKTSIYRDERIE